MPKLKFTEEARDALVSLRDRDPKKAKRVENCLAKIEANPRHPGLQTHKYEQMKGQNGENIFQSYVENRTPAAWRVFWHKGVDKDQIIIFAITPHP